VSLSTGAAGVTGTEQAYILNSLYDPNFTGTGHQPYSFDQFASFYGSYILHSCKVKLIACSIGGSAEVAICWKLDATGGSSTLAGITVDAATEAPMVGVGLLGASGNDRTFVKEFAVPIHTLFGITKKQYVNEVTTYGALTSANPTGQGYIHIAVASYTATAGETATVQALLEFDVEFFNPKELAQS